MEYVRCFCGKILCQVDGDKIYIKCRHCKRMVVLSLERAGEKGRLEWRVEEVMPEGTTIRTEGS